ncbi:MAG: GNAT family N-acetyltransferase [Alphaproteobacteria bacterium]|nr:MAG: GNAT family N-acetyltransferase [Alphaproteobacteria bacterium]
MTIRNFDALFAPRSIAIIGASRQTGSLGSVLAQNLFEGGFQGPVMPIHPNADHIHSVATYRNIASLPMVPDLAVIATPPPTIPGIIAELGAAGTRGAVVISAGFGEGNDPVGAELRQQMLNAAKPHLLRVIGPNCLGILVPGKGINASFAHVAARPGRIAFVAQSGAILTSVLDWATGRNIGFSHLVSLGDMSDVDFGDMLDYLANDPDVHAILLYIEAVTHARKFMSAARAAARMKPVIVVKAGRHPEGARAAATHTGALAGADDVYDAAVRRAGMLRVLTLEELFDAVETLSQIDLPHGDRLALVTNGGGIGVLAADSLSDMGGRLAALSAETIATLDRILPKTWSRANPVDIIGDAPGSRYKGAMEAVLADEGVDGVIAFHCPTAVADATEAAKAVIETARTTSKTVLANWLGDHAVRRARQIFAAAGLPNYDTPHSAIRAFMHLVTYRRNQIALMETPRSIPDQFEPDQQAVRAVIDNAIGDGRAWLTDPEAKAVLEAYGIAVPRRVVVRDETDAADAAARIAAPVALKILSPDITHKSDVGGVALDLEGPEAVGRAAAQMRARVQRAKPQAVMSGFVVEEMVRRRHSHELIVGVSCDPLFGPMILFGHGGTAVEIIGDRALAMPPLNLRLAHEVISRTRVYKLLRGFRDRPAANLEAVATTLTRISQLVVDHGEIMELDINPLVADPEGVVALDARIRIAKNDRPPTERLAIRPYPRELEGCLTTVDGREFLLRPIMPEDEPALQATFAKLTPDEIRMRFFAPIKTLPHVQAARFTQIDYDREMALVLTEPGIPGEAEIFGVVRLTADPDNERAEYAILVRHDVSGLGLGHMMMERITDYARARGIGEVWGDVLRENKRMLAICDDLGFTREAVDGEPAIVKVRLKLK